MIEAETVQAELIERYRQWTVATFEGDKALQARIEHEDAVFTYFGGRRYTQAEHIALTGQSERPHEHDITSLRVKGLRDDLAIVWLVHTLRTRLRANIFNDDDLRRRFETGIAFAVTTLWGRHEGEWRVLNQDAHILEGGYVPRQERSVPNVITYPDDIDQPYPVTGQSRFH